MKTGLLLAATICSISLYGCTNNVGLEETKASAAIKASVEEVQFSPAIPTQQTLPLQKDIKMLARVTAQMPRGGKSEFFGVCKGQIKSASVTSKSYLFAHFYSLPNRKRKAVKGGNAQFDLFLDVFSSAAPKAPAQLHRLNHVDLTQDLKCANGNWARGSDSINSVDLIWVNSKQHTIPTLKIQAWGTTMSGVVGCNGLIIFPEGLRGKPIVQDFEISSQMMGSVNSFFTDRDKRGFLVVRQEVTKSEMDFDKEQTTEQLVEKTYYDWNGKSFIARKSKSPAANPL